MSSPTPPFVPSAGDDDRNDDETATAVPTIEDERGERVVDPDVDGDLVDSARADRVAAGASDDDEVETLGEAGKPELPAR